jgi:hypothetical protein
MISKGTTHNNGIKLSQYMAQGKDGERAELWELRGFASHEVTEAFRSVHVMAQATRCEKPFFHVQVRNPEGESLTREQWLAVADRHERKLALTGQPRAISFHTDERTGHEHMHVAWSRIDAGTMTAKALPFFKTRLKQTSRELELHFNLTQVRNEREGPIRYGPTRAQEEQARRLGLDVHAIRNTIRTCWDRSDCGSTFQAALTQHDLVLARGDRRAFVVIDPKGGLHTLSKRILDIRAAEIRERLADLDHGQLPTVEQARGKNREGQNHPAPPAPRWNADAAIELEQQQPSSGSGKGNRNDKGEQPETERPEPRESGQPRPVSPAELIRVASERGHNATTFQATLAPQGCEPAHVTEVSAERIEDDRRADSQREIEKIGEQQRLYREKRREEPGRQR